MGAVFGPQSRHFEGWFGGSFNQGLNSYQFFTGAGKRFLHLSLEMQPRPAVLAGAKKVVDANHGLPVIVTTHEWLSPDKMERSNGHKIYFEGSDHLPPHEIWSRFIRQNPAIFLVLCRHS